MKEFQERLGTSTNSKEGYIKYMVPEQWSPQKKEQTTRSGLQVRGLLKKKTTTTTTTTKEQQAKHGQQKRGQPQEEQKEKKTLGKRATRAMADLAGE